MKESVYARIEKSLLPLAEKTQLKELTIGLGYTAALTEDGDCGVSFTYFTRPSASCTVVSHPMDVEGKPATELLSLIHSEKLIERASALAMANALNARRSREMERDSGDLSDKLGGRKYAMVGYFGPVVNQLKKKGIQIVAIDESKGIGDSDAFYRYLEEEAEALILTSTSLINGSTESILERLRPETKTILLGPTTPMIPEAFAALPVDYLGGIAVTDGASVIREIRHGKGTPAIMKHAEKRICALR